MKELEDIKADRIEIVAEQQQKKEIKLIDSQRKIRGLILWEFNYKTRELIPAKFQPLSVMISGGSARIETTEVSKVMVNENCIYLQALNRKNAIKQLNKVR